MYSIQSPPQIAEQMQMLFGPLTFVQPDTEFPVFMFEGFVPFKLGPISEYGANSFTNASSKEILEAMADAVPGKTEVGEIWGKVFAEWGDEFDTKLYKFITRNECIDLMTEFINDKMANRGIFLLPPNL